ncbi:MAG: putative porin [Bacteroidaceae bacterium]|nr:putative porin [Bacteroidaceae bacterium]
MSLAGLPSWARFVLSAQSDDYELSNYEDEEDNHRHSNKGNSRQSTSWGRDTTRGKQIPLPMGVFQWKIDPRLGTVIPSENTDTAVHNFQNWKLQEGMTGNFSHTGNTGSARLSRIFIERKVDKELIFLSPLDYFRGGISNFLFTNTKSPITNLAYHSCGNKQNGEERVRGNFATNINKISGVGFLLDYNYARGYYTNQQNSQFGGTVYGYYRGERYSMHAYINANHLKNAENGGITDDAYITQPWKYQQKFGTSDIPVNLNSTWNKNDDETYYLTHRYNLGYEREIIVPDSLKPKAPSDNELLLNLADSIRTTLSKDSVARKLAVDSLRKVWENNLVNPTEFIPVASIIHTFQMHNLNHTFYDQGNNSSFYTNQYWGKSSNIEDQTKVMSIRNTIGLAMNEGFKKWVKMGLTFFLTHEYRKYTQPILLEETLTKSSDSENDIFVGAEISKRNGKWLHYDVNGEFCLIGTNVGDFNINGQGDFKFPITKKDSATFTLKANITNTKPTYLVRNYRNAYFNWNNNNLSNEFRTGLQAEIKYDRTRTKLLFAWQNITNYTYLAMQNTQKNGASAESTIPADFTHDAVIRQSNASIQVFTAGIQQDIIWKIFGWENQITFQHSTQKDILPLPSINIYSNIYLQFRIAKVLRVQLGGDIRFFTKYYAPDYMGALGMFAIQDTNHKRMSIGNYPIINAYANFHLKHCRIYVNASHVNAGSGNMFLAPHMPMNPMSINFGLSWNFFN